MAEHVVTGPLAVVKDVDGKLRYYYTGAVLPKDVSADEVDRLVTVGLVSELDLPVVLVDVEKPAARKAAASRDST